MASPAPTPPPLPDPQGGAAWAHGAPPPPPVPVDIASAATPAPFPYATAPSAVGPSAPGPAVAPLPGGPSGQPGMPQRTPGQLEQPKRGHARIFPDAPPTRSVPAGVAAVTRARVEEHLRRFWPLFVVGTLFSACMLWLAYRQITGPWPDVETTLVLAVIGLSLPLGYLSLVAAHARQHFWRAWAEARGLRHHGAGALRSRLPLMRRGDEREWPQMASGRIGDLEATVALYQWRDVDRFDDDRRKGRPHRFTVVQVRLPDAVAFRYNGVYCHRRGPLHKLLQRIDGAREVTLESADLTRRFCLRTSARQDPVALYELFSTPFITMLTGLDFVAGFEQEGHDLVFFTSGYLGEAHELDMLCRFAVQVCDRYLQEDR